jgi:hypothetical protein
MSIERISWPTLGKRPREWGWKLIANGSDWTSPFDSGGQTLEFPGTRWWCTISYEELRESDWRILDAWLARMRGMSGRALFPMIQAEEPRGLATGTPVVSGAAQTGRSLVTAGWTASTAGILLTGDYFSVPTDSGPELKIITADADSDADGKTTLRFEPPLRNSPASGAALTVRTPLCPMRLYDADQGQLSLSTMRRGGWTGQFVEAWI